MAIGAIDLIERLWEKHERYAYQSSDNKPKLKGVLRRRPVLSPHRLAAAAIILNQPNITVFPNLRGMLIIVVMMEGATLGSYQLTVHL